MRKKRHVAKSKTQIIILFPVTYVEVNWCMVLLNWKLHTREYVAIFSIVKVNEDVKKCKRYPTLKKISDEGIHQIWKGIFWTCIFMFKMLNVIVVLFDVDCWFFYFRSYVILCVRTKVNILLSVFKCMCPFEQNMVPLICCHFAMCKTVTCLFYLLCYFDVSCYCILNFVIFWSINRLSLILHLTWSRTLEDNAIPGKWHYLHHQFSSCSQRESQSFKDFCYYFRKKWF